jgi:branched-subunit amino acid aminotransferase/4-amino-4-deoxychorismate lyase
MSGGSSRSGVSLAAGQARGPIWLDGRVEQTDTISINAADAALVHGVGLFETLRTWNGRAALLAEHLERMRQSAHCLEIDTAGVAWPDADAIGALVHAAGTRGDCGVRITLTGGAPGCAPRLWMRLFELPAEPRFEETSLGTRFGVLLDDPLARHKTLNYARKRLAFGVASAAGDHDALAVDPSGRIWETARANIFGLADATLWTPELAGPVLPGVMRGMVLRTARRLGLRTVEGAVDWPRMRAVFLTNAVRGVVPIRRLDEQVYDDGPAVVAPLRDALNAWLESAGGAP